MEEEEEEEEEVVVEKEVGGIGEGFSEGEKEEVDFVFDDRLNAVETTPPCVEGFDWRSLPLSLSLSLSLSIYPSPLSFMLSPCQSHVAPAFVVYGCREPLNTQMSPFSQLTSLVSGGDLFSIERAPSISK